MIRKALLTVAGTALLSNCGSEQEQIVKRFSYDILDNELLHLELEFNSNIELNTEFTIPILEYGSISMFPSSQDTGVTVGADLNLAYIDDRDILDLERTRRLPNGQPLSPYIEEDLSRIRVQLHDRVYTSVYLGTSEEKMYFGNSIEFEFGDADFPAGLVISQRIRDRQGRSLGVVTLFGPHMVDNGKTSGPGGIFLATNVSDLQRHYQDNSIANHGYRDKNGQITVDLLPDNDTFISEPVRNSFKDVYDYQRLIDTFSEQIEQVSAD